MKWRSSTKYKHTAEGSACFLSLFFLQARLYIEYANTVLRSSLGILQLFSALWPFIHNVCNFQWELTTRQRMHIRNAAEDSSWLRYTHRHPDHLFIYIAILTGNVYKNFFLGWFYQRVHPHTHHAHTHSMALHPGGRLLFSIFSSALAQKGKHHLMVCCSDNI